MTRIADIRDPGLFQRLVHTLFSAERGKAFQTVDDSAGDAGNDGYDAESGWLVAIYCPEKEETAKRTLAKAREDLGKAGILKTRPGYRISEWVLVTPHGLTESVQATLRVEAEALGLQATFLSATNLEHIYLKYPHLHDLFPELTYPQVLSELQEMNRKLDNLIGAASPTAEQRNADPPSAATDTLAGKQPVEYLTELLPGFRSDKLAALQRELYGGEPGATHRLEQFRLEALDPRERAVALLIETDFAAEQLDFSKVERIAAEGWRLTKDTGSMAEAALFAARQAHAMNMVMGGQEMDFIARLGMSATVGVPMVSTREAGWYDREVPQRRSAINDLFKTAYEYARTSRNLVALFRVALLYAHATTHAALVLQVPGNELLRHDKDEEVARLKGIVEAAYDLAISVARAMSSQEFLGTAYSNFANDLRSFGEIDRAVAHAQRGLALALEAEDDRQVRKTQQLLSLLTKQQ